MKKLFFLLVVFSIAIPAQSKDSVDIRAMVQKQINAALERDRLEQVKRDSLANVKIYFGPAIPSNLEKTVYFGPEPEYFGPKEAPVNPVFVLKNDSLAKANAEKLAQNTLQKVVNSPILVQKSKSNNDNWKYYFLGAVTVLAFSFVFFRRMLSKRLGKQGKTIKNNIRILRGENLIEKEHPQLKLLRSQLVNSPVILNNHGKALSEVAKELNIAQGEIILAAKIKSYELSKSNNNKLFLN